MIVNHCINQFLAAQFSLKWCCRLNSWQMKIPPFKTWFCILHKIYFDVYGYLANYNEPGPEIAEEGTNEPTNHAERALGTQSICLRLCGMQPKVHKTLLGCLRVGTLREYKWRARSAKSAEFDLKYLYTSKDRSVQYLCLLYITS